MTTLRPVRPHRFARFLAPLAITLLLAPAPARAPLAGGLPAARAHARAKPAVPRRPAVATVAVPDTGEMLMYVSPRAPYGDRRAAPYLTPTCGDTVTRDTLYLSFVPARSESTFLGFSGELFVYASPGDTLGSFWDMGRGGANNGGMVVQFPPDPSFPEPAAFTTASFGGAAYDRTARSGRFRFFCAVRLTEAHAVQAGRRYVLGRVILGSRHVGLTGCERPVCLEWHSADFGWRQGTPEHATMGGSRWAAWGTSATTCKGQIPGYRPKGFGTTPP